MHRNHYFARRRFTLDRVKNCMADKIHMRRNKRGGKKVGAAFKAQRGVCCMRMSAFPAVHYAFVCFYVNMCACMCARVSVHVSVHMWL
jgi:hypothetical protein